MSMSRSTDGGQSFEHPRTIPPTGTRRRARLRKIVAGAHGLVCVVADELSHWDSSGDLVGQAVAVCSTDAGNSFRAPVQSAGSR
jgi:hypothetical protein